MPGIYCTRCGFENQPTRGACLMCDNMLRVVQRATDCAACGEGNPRHAQFCFSCGGAIEVGAVAAPVMAELATRVLEAVGGGGGGAIDDDEIGPYEDEGDFVETGDEDLGAAQLVEEAGHISKPPAEEVADSAIPGPILDEAAAEPAAEIEPDEDFAPPPPPGVIEADDDEDFAPPPPPGVVTPDEDEDFAPPPPPGVVEADAGEEEEFALPPPPGVVAPEPAADLDEDEFAPPPPPPGVVDMDEEEQLPPVTEAAPDGEAAQDDDANFGDWALDFDEDDKEQ